MRIGRAEARSAAHNDVDAFAHVITGWRTGGGTGRVWIAVESLYSMDGDRAPAGGPRRAGRRARRLPADRRGPRHRVFGRDGRGLAEHQDGRENVVTLRTCGKALGCEGGAALRPRILQDFLVNRARAFIFSTAPSPLMAAAVRAALRLLVSEPQRRTRLMARVAEAGTRLAPYGAIVTDSQILPLLIGDDGRTMQVAGRLQVAGFDVRGIRPPTVRWAPPASAFRSPPI